jgi:hypothetical protein
MFPAMTYDEPLVARLLAAQGYAVPATDVPEIAQRLQALLTAAAAWDALAPQDDEPWWPFLEAASVEAAPESAGAGA